MNYISGVNDERFNRSNYAREQLYEEAFLAYGVYSNYGIKGKDWITTDFHYNVELGYDPRLDPRVGNPLMRTFEVGFQKRF